VCVLDTVQPKGLQAPVSHLSSAPHKTVWCGWCAARRGVALCMQGARPRPAVKHTCGGGGGGVTVGMGHTASWAQAQGVLRNTQGCCCWCGCCLNCRGTAPGCRVRSCNCLEQVQEGSGCCSGAWVPLTVKL
jgi:hypothetical protein